MVVRKSRCEVKLRKAPVKAYTESYAKKLTRSLAWPLAIRHHGPADKALVLTGNAGDLAFLRSAGRDLASVVAVDTDAACTDAARARYPEADVRTCTVSQYVQSPDAAGLTCAWLDFCAPINRDTLRTLCETASRIAVGGRGGTVVATFLCGRDDKMRGAGDVSAPSVGCADWQRRRLADDPKHAWRMALSSDMANGADPLSRIRAAYPQAEPWRVRVTLVREMLRNCGWWVPAFGFQYFGTSPMITLGFTLSCGDPKYARIDEVHRAYYRDGADKADYDACVKRHDAQPWFPLYPAPHYSWWVPWAEFSERYARDQVLCSAAKNAEAFNLSPAQLSARKAVRTRKEI